MSVNPALLLQQQQDMETISRLTQQLEQTEKELELVNFRSAQTYIRSMFNDIVILAQNRVQTIQR